MTEERTSQDTFESSQLFEIGQTVYIKAPEGVSTTPLTNYLIRRFGTGPFTVIDAFKSTENTTQLITFGTLGSDIPFKREYLDRPLEVSSYFFEKRE